ncbi:MAG: hypothetical protein WA125_12700, partial [Desulfosporosinus sp.]
MSKSKKLISCVAITAMISGLMLLISPFTAVAASPAATSGLLVKVYNSDESSSVTLKNYSITDFDGASWTKHQQTFSSIDNYPSPVVSTGNGVYLSDILTDAVQGKGIDLTVSTGDVNQIKLRSTDAYYTTLSYDTLFATRYYYPNLVSTWDTTNREPDVNSPTTKYDSSVQVYPMLTLDSFQSRFLSNSTLTNITNLQDRLNTFRFCYGETATDIDHTSYTRNTSKFNKWTNEVDIILKAGESLPSGNAVATSSPVLSGSYTSSGIVAYTTAQNVPITFTDSSAWRSNITSIVVDGTTTLTLTDDYTIAAGQITILA